MELLCAMGTVAKWVAVCSVVLVGVAAVTKPTQASLKPYANQFSAGSVLARKLKRAVNHDQLYHQDMILFRLAGDDGNLFLGIFGAWFKIDWLLDWLLE